jgi:hypothetical protein
VATGVAAAVGAVVATGAAVVAAAWVAASVLDGAAVGAAPHADKTKAPAKITKTTIEFHFFISFPLSSSYWV